MKSKIAVISSVYGSYDSIKSSVRQTIDADWIFVTDHDFNVPPWRVIIEPRSPRTEPRLASRVPKCNPWLYTDADIVIWIDGNIAVTSPYFIEWCLESLGDNVICQQRQYFSDDVFTEMANSFQVGGLGKIPLHRQAQHLSGDHLYPEGMEWKAKWADDPILEQITEYQARGYPPDYGIWWCGMMIRTKDCPDFGDKWMTEMVRWTCQDQLAHSYLMHMYDLKPVGLDFTSSTITGIFKYLPKSGGPIQLYEYAKALKSEYFTRHLHPDNTT